MKSSAISSANPILPIGEKHSRKAFALTGPSVILDPATHAVRGDLADVRLAEYVFAPHYAAPMPCTVTRATALCSTRHCTDSVTELSAGEQFDVLELAGQNAWGIAAERGLVGYIDRGALDRSVATAS